MPILLSSLLMEYSLMEFDAVDRALNNNVANIKDYLKWEFFYFIESTF